MENGGRPCEVYACQVGVSHHYITYNAALARQEVDDAVGYASLLSTLKKNGVQEIDTTIDFDPNFHHAVMQEDGEESGKILEIFQKGYLLKEKVIRPAMVKVSN